MKTFVLTLRFPEELRPELEKLKAQNLEAWDIISQAMDGYSENTPNDASNFLFGGYKYHEGLKSKKN